MGVRFGSQRMAENYLFRPAYSNEVYDTLLGLMRDQPRTLLDVGCGPGKLTLGLVDHVDRIDAIDPADEMLRVARSLPKSNDPKIRWTCARAEDAEFSGPYGLIVAGASIHWMDRDRVLPKFRGALSPGAFLAVLAGDAPIDPPWESEATNFMLDFLERREGKRPAWWANATSLISSPILTHPAFEPVDARVTQPVEISQTIDDFLRCEHSRATWSEEILGESDVREFDARMTRILTPHANNGVLTYSMQTRIEWGNLRTSAF